MKEQMPQSKTGTFRACLQLPLHLEAPAALCKMLPELLKLVRAQRFACVSCWDMTLYHACSRWPEARCPFQGTVAAGSLLPWQRLGSCLRQAESERGRFGSPCQVSFSTVAKPLLGSGLGFWHPLCIRSGVVVSVVVS